MHEVEDYDSERGIKAHVPEGDESILYRGMTESKNEEKVNGH